MNLLAVDTTSQGCSAALWRSGQIFERSMVAPRGHTQHLLPMIRQVTAEGELDLTLVDGLAFGCGPGSFTGLRIATGVVQGLAWGLELPVVPVSSLLAVAAQAVRLGQVGEGEQLAVTFDARMKEVYWQCFLCRQGHPVPLGEAQVSAPSDVVLPEGASTSWVGVGSGWMLKDQFSPSVRQQIARTDDKLYPLAADIAALAAVGWSSQSSVKASEVAPVYVRNTVSWKKLPGR